MVRIQDKRPVRVWRLSVRCVLATGSAVVSGAALALGIFTWFHPIEWRNLQSVPGWSVCIENAHVRCFFWPSETQPQTLHDDSWQVDLGWLGLHACYAGTFHSPGAINIHEGRYDIFVHLWLPFVLFALYPAWRFRGWLRKRSRIRLGLCETCGYDLRGNRSGRCPECGSAAPRPAPDQSEK